jgi:hypothetical protein
MLRVQLLRGGQQAAVVESVSAGKRPDFRGRTRRYRDGPSRQTRILVRRPGHVQVIGEAEVEDDRVRVGSDARRRRRSNLNLGVVKLFLAVVKLKSNNNKLKTPSVDDNLKFRHYLSI